LLAATKNVAKLYNYTGPFEQRRNTGYRTVTTNNWSQIFCVLAEFVGLNDIRRKTFGFANFNA